MRFFGLCVSALAAVALADSPPSYESTTTSVAKATITRTVMRVVETVTATRNGSVTAYESTSTETSYYHPSATGYLPGYNNGTTGLGTPAHPTISKTGSSAPTQTTNAAGKFGVEAIGIAAIAGLVGLAVF